MTDTHSNDAATTAPGAGAPGSKEGALAAVKGGAASAVTAVRCPPALSPARARRPASGHSTAQPSAPSTSQRSTAMQSSAAAGEGCSGARR